MKFRVFALTTLLCVVSLGLASAQTTAPDPNPEITARAKEWLHRVQTGDLDRSQFDANMNAALTPELVQQAASKMAPLGEPLAFTFLRIVTSGELTVYIYTVTFKSRALEEQFALDKDGKIAGIQFVPPE